MDTLATAAIRGIQRKTNQNILTEVPQRGEAVSIQNDKGWKIVAQAKALKEHFGFGTVFGLIAVFISLAGPIAYQSKTNATAAASIDNLAKEQEQSRVEVARDLERQTKATNEAVARIEALVGQTVDLAKQNREDMRAIRAEFSGRLGLVEQKSDSNWNLLTDLKTRVGQVEIEAKRKENK